ncbi:MAG TPA: glyoxalase [Elusimicrobia bacterium]|nr:MAG: glyoxalase [Elusimicrobia bacterium GWF2_62_30]HBA60895.1 glyoxalase [Elusimicrobiota bacterium]
MKFCWCTIGVKDLEKSIKFYKEILGLPVCKRFSAGPKMEICFMGEGETKVELVCGSDYKAKNDAKAVSLGFEVKSVEETIAFIKEKGLKVDDGPYQPNPHIKFFYIKDPDGISIRLVENL